MTLSSPSEDVVTSVTALGPPGESCDGACLDVAQYIWDTAVGALDLKATEDPSGKYLTRAFNSNGLPTKITYGDADSDPNNNNSVREVYFYYGNPSFPGLVTETRRKSEFEFPGTFSACSATDAAACARTITTYDANGQVSTVQEIGYTLSSSGIVTPYNSTTTYTYDAAGKGRLAQIDGPLAGSHDVTLFEYWSSSDPMKDGFLQHLKRKRDSNYFLTQSSVAFDFWGNATALADADGTLSCQTFSPSRNYLTERRELMAGQTSCTPNSADLVTSYARDAALRLTLLTRPDGACVGYTYDAKGRLETIRRRDNCNIGSQGDTTQYTYSDDGLVTDLKILDGNGDLKRRQEMTYFDSRRLEKLLNPANPSKWTGHTYDPRGLTADITDFDGSTPLRKTAWGYNAEGRVEHEKRYTAGTAFDTWTLLFDWIGNQKQVTDGDSKVTQSVRDDLGRLVKLVSPDLGGHPTLRIFDNANRLTTIVESFGGPSPQTHSFTFDYLGRPLEANYEGVCDTGSGGVPHAEILRVFDAPPTCPSGMTCGNTSGRLAYVKSTLLCSGAYATSDGALDQETWYQYDAAGRLIREHIKDDSSRVADHQYAWTKNGALQQTTTPSGAVLGSTYGSTGNNSDTDRVTALWRTTSSTPIIDNILWNPFGPLRKFNQMNTYAGQPLYTSISRNLAYRPTLLEIKTNFTNLSAFTINEDAKGRVTARLPWPASVGWQESHFQYDQQDRVLCETTSSVSSCPTSGTNIKNSHNASPPFTAAGDWKGVLRPIPGTSCLNNNYSLVSGTHQLYEVLQPPEVNPSGCLPNFRITRYQHDSRGNRSSDNNQILTYDGRTFTYDARRNVQTVVGQYNLSGTWRTYYLTSAFDSQNRRVYKSFLDTTTSKVAEWFFYYDALNRLVEVRHTPDTSSPSTYSVFQLFWLGDRLVLYWQTDYPSATTSRRYVGTDESGRPIEMNDWPSGGAWSRVWAINPSAWGADINLIGPSVFQPVLFAGQYLDSETATYHSDGATIHRTGVALNGHRTYDAFVGAYLQVDPLVESTWSTYVYAGSDPVGKNDPLGLAMKLVFVVDLESKRWGDCWDSSQTIEVSSCLGGHSWEDDWFGSFGSIGGGGGGGNLGTDSVTNPCEKSYNWQSVQLRSCVNEAAEVADPSFTEGTKEDGSGHGHRQCSQLYTSMAEKCCCCPNLYRGMAKACLQRFPKGKTSQNWHDCMCKAIQEALNCSSGCPGQAPAFLPFHAAQQSLSLQSEP